MSATDGKNDPAVHPVGWTRLGQGRGHDFCQQLSHWCHVSNYGLGSALTRLQQVLFLLCSKLKRSIEFYKDRPFSRISLLPAPPIAGILKMMLGFSTKKQKQKRCYLPLAPSLSLTHTLTLLRPNEHRSDGSNKSRRRVLCFLECWC